jgi:hypothetical protein
VSQGTNTENNINSDQKHNTTEENTHHKSDQEIIISQIFAANQ